MKRTASILVSILICIGTLCAQDNDIRFALMPVEGDGITEEVASAANIKIRQGLSRSNALSDNTYEVFSVVPTLVVENASVTEGLITEVAVMTAELTLSAVNKIDGTTYHTTVIPLKTAAKNGGSKVLESLVREIKPNDAVFVRFVRLARQKISDYYSNNCSKILAVAKNLADTGRKKEAFSYLSAVSPSVECYEQASLMLQDLAEMPQQPEIIIETIVDTVFVENVPDVPPMPEPRAGQAPEPEIILGSDDIRFKILSCTGDVSTGKIYILSEFENLRRDSKDARAYIETAFDRNGNELPESAVKDRDKKWRPYCYVNTPYRLPVKVSFYVGGFDGRVDCLSFTRLYFRGVEVIVKNLPVIWH